VRNYVTCGHGSLLYCEQNASTAAAAARTGLILLTTLSLFSTDITDQFHHADQVLTLAWQLEVAAPLHHINNRQTSIMPQGPIFTTEAVTDTLVLM